MTVQEQLTLPLPDDQAPAWLEALIERHLDLMEQAPPRDADQGANAPSLP
jgi:hypothetical protein